MVLIPITFQCPRSLVSRPSCFSSATLKCWGLTHGQGYYTNSGTPLGVHCVIACRKSDKTRQAVGTLDLFEFLCT